jgi:hypothetical protein
LIWLTSNTEEMDDANTRVTPQSSSCSEHLFRKQRKHPFQNKEKGTCCFRNRHCKIHSIFTWVCSSFPVVQFHYNIAKIYIPCKNRPMHILALVSASHSALGGLSLPVDWQSPSASESLATTILGCDLWQRADTATKS